MGALFCCSACHSRHADRSSPGEALHGLQGVRKDCSCAGARTTRGHEMGTSRLRTGRLRSAAPVLHGLLITHPLNTNKIIGSLGCRTLPFRTQSVWCEILTKRARLNGKERGMRKRTVKLWRLNEDGRKLAAGTIEAADPRELDQLVVGHIISSWRQSSLD